MGRTPTLARRLWEAIEPIHSVVYFAPEPAAHARRIGLRGFWMSYFAGRVAPLGPVPAGPAVAMVFGFAPAMVARAIPDAWHFANPEVVVQARITGATEALRAHLDPLPTAELDELSSLLWEAVAGCTFEGRPLASAWSEVPRPDDSVSASWLASTVLREHRGDGHVIAAVGAGLGGLDATVTLVAMGAATREIMQPNRGWSDTDWDRSLGRLEDRGLLDHGGHLTTTGRRLRNEIEDLTDQLAAAPLERLGAAGIERAIDLAAPMSRQLVDSGIVPVPNPVGAPRP